MAAKKTTFLFGIILSCVMIINLSAVTKPDIKGFDDGLFRYHFDRADRELDPVSWLKTAREGIGLVLAGWERTILELYGDPEFRLESEKEIALWSEEELERRFSEWLVKRFLGEYAGTAVLEEALDAAKLSYVYHTDDQGKIIYGETGDPEAIRPDEGRSIEDDLDAWRELTSKAGEAELASYSSALASLCPEIISYISEENRPAFEARLGSLFRDSLLGKEAEFKAILAREERLFIARRTGDVWSLRKQSENESASAISSRLIQDAADVCASGIASLETRVETAKAGTGDLALMGSEWLAAFEEQFDRGLKAWTDAEEQFIIRRIEWERDSGESFLSGEEAWKNAFAELERERALWEDRAKELFVSGEKVFYSASVELEKAIADAKIEFERDAVLRTSAGADRAKAWVDIYVTCGSVIAEAKNSTAFWFSRFISSSGSPLIGKDPNVALEDGTLESLVRAVLNSQNLSGGQVTAGNELIRWAGIYARYKEKVQEAMETLQKEFGLALGLDAGALNSVLGADSEGFHLDEYQVELLRAQAAASYWAQRLAAAEAVSAYAADLSAGRMTEAESLARWRTAKASYDEALASYAAVQEQLNGAELELSRIQEGMLKAAEDLEAAERRLEDLNSQYALKMAAYRLQSQDFALQELGNCYAALEELKSYDDSYYTAYLNSLRRYSIENSLNEGWSKLAEITGLEDLELRNRQLALLHTESAADWYFAMTGQEAGVQARALLNEEGILQRLKREAAEGDPEYVLLLGIYRDLAAYAPAALEETASTALRKLAEIFAGYTLNVSAGSIPDPETLAKALFKYCRNEGKDPAAAIAGLFVRIDTETELVPDWVSEKLVSWKDSFLLYFADMAEAGYYPVPENGLLIRQRYDELTQGIQDSLSSGEISEEMILEASYYGYLVSYLDCYSMGKGDFENADTAGKRLEKALKLFKEGDPPASVSALKDAAGEYLADPEKEFENHYDLQALFITFELYKQELEKLENLTGEEQYLGSEIYKLTQLLEENGDLETGIQKSSAAIEKMREEYQALLDRYNTMTGLFAEAGLEYEALYSNAKQKFSTLEKIRQNYEKEDAIRRWASTAYLSDGSDSAEDARYSGGSLYYKNPAQELAFARERNDRAQIALEALKNLYGKGEYSRPYNDPEYNRMYEAYQDSFSRMLLTYKAQQELEKRLAEERVKNAALQDALSFKALSFLNPALPGNYEQYSVPAPASAGWQDFFSIDGSGRLIISYDHTTFRMNQLSAEGAAMLSDYFLGNGGTNGLSGFQTALADWSVRMASYNLNDMAKYQNWGLALDYLTRQLLENNPGCSGLGGYDLTGMGSDGGIKLDGENLNSWLSRYRGSELKNVQADAWNSLTSAEQADLEFLLTLLLTGGGDEGVRGFLNISELREMQWLYDEAKYYEIPIKLFGHHIKTICRWPYFFDSSELKQVLKISGNKRDAYNKVIDEGRIKFKQTLTDYSQTLLAYQQSCRTMADIMGRKENGETIEWNDIKRILTDLDGFNAEEIKTLNVYWDEMLAFYNKNGISAAFTDAASALESLNLWAKGIRNAAVGEFEQAYLSAEREGLEAQDNYRKAYSGFMDGSVSLDVLKKAADAAYGSTSYVRKNHLGNLGNTILADLAGVTGYDGGYIKVFQELAAGYAALVQRTYASRFEMELAAREAEWNEQRRDLNEKTLAWQEASVLILERGRSDWKTGLENMQSGYAQWIKTFNEDYERVSAAWDAAYYESITDKEAWVDHAVEAADNAYTGALLSSIGSEAETGSRRLSAFLPSGIPGYGGNEAAALSLSGVLSSAGIMKLSDAFGAIAGSADTVKTTVSSGLGGLGLWNAGRAMAAAKELAIQSSTDLASGKMMILAVQARETALAAKKELEEKVKISNQEFDAAMDELYTLSGGWSRTGQNYIRDVIVHSTFFQNAITDKVVVQAYKYYVMDYWEFTTSLDDAYLEGFDYMGIQALVGLTQQEIQAKSEEIFGIDGDSGLFGNWLGAAPSEINSEGSGELGRLLREYYSWSEKQANGIALMSTPLWEKPLWDSRGSFFSAPNLRTVADIGMTVVASVFTGPGSIAFLALTLVDDAVFSVLDVAGGHKTWDEAGFAFGQKALTSVVSSKIGGFFDGLTDSAVASAKGFKGVLDQTILSGAKTLVTSTATSALNAVSYNRRNGFGWSADTFGAGMLSGFTSAAVDMTSTFTSGTFGLLNTGYNAEKLKGFSGENKGNVNLLNETFGGLAGQGVNYALTGDFAVNVLRKFDTGLLELHFGDQGFGMNLGMGGIDMSLGTISGSIAGAAVWGVNTNIKEYTDETELDIAVALRAQYGFGDKEQKNQLWDILAGNTEIVIDNGDYEGKTVNENGKRIIYLGGYKEGMTESEQMRLGVILGHEAYRDGTVTEDNYLETRTTTLAHTELAIRMLQDGYGIDLGGNLFDDLNAYFKANNNADLFNAYVDENYDSTADFWRLVKRDDGSFGLQYDGNHSLIDEDGNILVRSFLDLFGGSGEIIGHRVDSPNSYVRSLGMLMGMFPTFTDSNSDRERYKQYEAFWRNNDSYYRTGIKNMMLDAGFEIGADTVSNPANNGSLSVNSFLMTYKDIISGRGVESFITGGKLHVRIKIKNDHDVVVGSVIETYQAISGSKNYVMVENMIPEGRRLKAGTFSIELNNGIPSIKMFGLGSTMPDPSRMGPQHPALADGRYSAAWSLHLVTSSAAYRAFRLFCAEPSSWEQVTGPRGAANISNFNYSEVNNWGNPAYRGNFPAYYYANGKRVADTTNAINAHLSFLNPYVYHGDYTAGSDGCLVWPSPVYNELTRGLQTTANPNTASWGYFTINRTFFGDGTGNKNNWWAP